MPFTKKPPDALQYFSPRDDRRLDQQSDLSWPSGSR
jgi:hypothetical protein